MTRKKLLKSVSVSAIGLATLVGCGQGAQPSTSSPAASAPPATTLATTVSPTPSAVPTTTTTTPPVTAESSYSATAIRSIAIETRTGSAGRAKRVGPELYEIPEKGVGSIVIQWAARGENGNVKSRDCMVIVDTTGPGGLDERRRSEQCTGSTGIGEHITVRVPGVYTVTVNITPPDGGAPVIGTQTFEVILKGN